MTLAKGATVSTARHFLRPHFHSTPRRRTRTIHESTSLLLSLPPELQIIVYRNLLLAPQAIIELWSKLPSHNNSSTRRYHDRSHHLVKSHRHNLHVALLRTCRSIYTVASPILYTENAFRFTDLDGWLSLSSFLLTIGSRCRPLLRDITAPVPLPGVLYQCPKHVFAAEYDDELELVRKRIVRLRLPTPPVRGNAAAFQHSCRILAKHGALRSLTLVVAAEFGAQDERPSCESEQQWRTAAVAGVRDWVSEISGSSLPVEWKYPYRRGKGYEKLRPSIYMARGMLQRLRDAMPELQIGLLELESAGPHPTQCSQGLRCRKRQAVWKLMDPGWKTWRATVGPSGEYDVEEGADESFDPRQTSCFYDVEGDWTGEDVEPSGIL